MPIEPVSFISLGWTTTVERGKECLWFARYSYVAGGSPVRIVKIWRDDSGALWKTVWKFLDNMDMIDEGTWAHMALEQATVGEVDSISWRDVIRREEWKAFL
jgi:hypothetical protein